MSEKSGHSLHIARRVKSLYFWIELFVSVQDKFWHDQNRFQDLGANLARMDHINSQISSPKHMGLHHDGTGLAKWTVNTGPSEASATNPFVRSLRI